jgi:LysM repeat protein
MSRAIVVLLVVASCYCAAAAVAVNPPPKPLHKVGDHWTPYEQPTEFPPDAEVYVIQPGDTLWDLAQKFLGNPYLWPQLWEQNTYIRDAHWIYPGDPLVVGVKAAEVPAEGAGAAEAAAAAGAVVPAEGAGEGGAVGALVPIGSEDDLYCFGYLGGEDDQPLLTLSSAELVEYQEHFVAGDIVYLSQGAAEGVQAGQEFTIIRPGRNLKHPATGARLGRVMSYLGHLRVLCTQEHSATAEILSSCDAIPLGSWLAPFEPLPIPMTVLTAPADCCTEPNDLPKGYITYSKDDALSFGQGHVVLLDLGEADQLAPGSICTIYRDNPTKGMPRIVLGEAAVLTTGEHWSTAKIIRSRLPLKVGDRIEVK